MTAVSKCVQKVSPTETGIAEARNRAVEAFQRVGVQDSLLFPIELCIHEALVNALVHGVYECGASEIRFSYKMDDRSVCLTVEDNGSKGGKAWSHGFWKARAQQGQGLVLIHALMSRVNTAPSGCGICMELDIRTESDSTLRSIRPKTRRRTGVFQ